MNCAGCAKRRIVNAKLLHDGLTAGLVKPHRIPEQKCEWEVRAVLDCAPNPRVLTGLFWVSFLVPIMPRLSCLASPVPSQPRVYRFPAPQARECISSAPLSTAFECLQRHLAPFGDTSDSLLNRTPTELRWIERTPVPADHILVAWVTAVGHCFNEIHEAG